jgi:hypothetical protein
MKTNKLILYTEIIMLYSKNQRKYKNEVLMLNGEFLTDLGLHKVTTGVEMDI